MPEDHAAPDHGPNITDLLGAWRREEDGALDRVIEGVYPELLRIARQRLRRERDEHTLQPSALVNEAYLRLSDQRRVEWTDRSHFYAIASKVMRRILVDHARARQRLKRRGLHVSLHDADAQIPQVDVDVLDLDRALSRLEQEGFSFECQVVQLRFFTGLTNDEAAAALGSSRATVGRAWTFARTWLYRELRGDPPPDVDGG